MKKLGILTLPIKTNYGGILQVYALLTFLRKNGYDAWFIKRRWNSEKQGKLHKILKYIYHHVIIRKFNRFIDQYIQPQTEVIDTERQVTSLNYRRFDGFIVGSDQVWRMRNVRGVGYNYFLDFVSQNHVKRISYAASFGVDYWDDSMHSDETIPLVKSLLHKFDAISVREDTGVKLCQTLFDIKAIHVIDPTLLLQKEDYLYNLDIHITPKEYLGVYILDMTEEKKEMIHKLSELLSLPVVYLNKKCNNLDCFLPSIFLEINKQGVKEWLKSVAESSFIFTDSFHGLAFSIIFEKQFLVIGNAKRGLTRFESILKMFRLQNKMIFYKGDISKELIEDNIDYSIINEIIGKKQKEASIFINSIWEN